ncbi:hypothetical protein HNV12_01575 [Methanococcoides sp. SA1]|nr:hypothetical protein [Methanococcoides sp. SA1]
MEINLACNYDFRDNEQVDQVDKFRRNIFEKFPEAIWERNENGHTITI